LHKYIAGTIKGKGHKPIIVNGMPGHIHAFVGLKLGDGNFRFGKGY